MKKFLMTLGALGVAALAIVAVAVAATVVVTPTNTQGWSTADTRPGGAVNYVADASAPGGSALQLTTDATTAAKAQYIHAANTPLSDVDELAYSTKQNSASFAQADPSYQLLVNLDGTAATFTTFVYEPYNQLPAPVIVPGAWQSWDVDAGGLWSSRNVNAGGSCVVAAGAGGPPFYTLAGLQAACPSAVVVGFGVNVGTFNPSYDVETDLVNFDGTVYDFQLGPTSKDDCKNGGWQSFSNPTFKNQGDCVSYVATGGKNGANG
jgi:hypothetical protein